VPKWVPDLIGQQSPFQRLIVSSTLTAFDLTEQKDQPFRRCRVSENRIAQHRKRHSPDHRGLDGGHKFARPDAKRGESQDLVASRANLPTWPTLGRRHTKVPPRVV
jgi:hypothetical protein